MPENRSSSVIPLDQIKSVDASTIKDYQRSYNHHGFLNELYDRLVDKNTFNLSKISFGFSLELFQGGGAASESGITINVNLFEVAGILKDYFSRHPDVFARYFPDRAHTPVDNVINEIYGSTLLQIIRKGDVLSTLEGIYPLLDEDPTTHQKLEELLQKMSKTIVHEKAHVTLNKLSEYYGLSLQKYSADFILILRDDQESHKKYEEMMNQIRDETDTDVLKNIAEDYLRFIISRLRAKQDEGERETDALKEYLKKLYAAGIEEVVIRLIEAQIDHLSSEQTIQKLKDELFQRSGYYGARAGAILPDADEVYAVVQSMPLEQAYHRILEKYNDKSFDEYLEKSGVLKQTRMQMLLARARSMWVGLRSKTV